MQHLYYPTCTLQFQVAHKGVNNVLSAVHHHLTTRSTDARHLIWWGDSAPGQLKNFVHMHYCVELCHPRSTIRMFDRVDAKFPPVGHTYLVRFMLFCSHMYVPTRTQLTLACDSDAGERPRFRHSQAASQQDADHPVLAGVDGRRQDCEGCATVSLRVAGATLTPEVEGLHFSVLQAQERIQDDCQVTPQAYAGWAMAKLWCVRFRTRACSCMHDCSWALLQSIA